MMQQYIQKHCAAASFVVVGLFVWLAVISGVQRYIMQNNLISKQSCLVIANKAAAPFLTCAMAKGLSIALPESPKGLVTPFAGSLLPTGKAPGCCKGGGRKRLRLVVL